jgi:transcriptional regulator with GAF, ATPase, and Fis domain
MFSVTTPGQARRPAALYSLVGTALPLDQVVPPGSVVAVGDRTLLHLTMCHERGLSDRLGMVGESDRLWDVRRRVAGVAQSEGTVLVCGESGVGKELVAGAIHRASSRRELPFLVVNCAAIPENLLESELFGHKKGAFTGATGDKDGFFRAAGRGSLFLDEIGELPLAMQSKLLRVLQERKVRPVGSVAELPVEARIIVATNRTLSLEVVAGRFREDLLYRLTTLTIEIPPLRERREDIPLLFATFLRQRSDSHPQLDRFWREANQYPPPLPMSFFRRLLAESWPGNIRELHNVVEKTAIANIHSSRFIAPEELAGSALLPAFYPVTEGSLAQHMVPRAPPQPIALPREPLAKRASAERIDETTLLGALEQFDYVQRQVAEALSVSHTTVDRWMREYGLRRPRDIGREELQQAAEEAGHSLEQMARALRVSRRGLQLRLRALGIEGVT